MPVRILPNLPMAPTADGAAMGCCCMSVSPLDTQLALSLRCLHDGMRPPKSMAFTFKPSSRQKVMSATKPQNHVDCTANTSRIPR